MLVGYARVSTPSQNLDLQIKALKEAGCDKIFTDIANGAKTARPGLKDAEMVLREGDALVVWKLDRLGRSIQHLIESINDLKEKGIGFRSLQEAIDTQTSGGKLVFHIFSALAEFERDLIRERTNAGLEAARARGKKGGRPKSLDQPKNIKLLKQMHADPSYSIGDICKTLDISRSTFYRYLKSDNNENDGQ
ncbi:resolvase [Photorhabdus temperata]|uniref:Recombinase family protein n=3 Tax=Photorhabdus TaxID=29487 RepID=A0A7X5QQD4_9GAMM|nr:recombinase family protein [Photorhabdus khanii]ETS30733.1 site-specific recombinase, DNA invertase Pin [Photorhabdus khanii NC19]MQL47212.1 helix-turn-helix domain-containing protein [Photorhabdus khanii]NHB98544.1 recombinase family protein [Photorhabdus stackebrandtii]OHV55805.1 resolvase [Photorhabdus temperata]